MRSLNVHGFRLGMKAEHDSQCICKAYSRKRERNPFSEIKNEMVLSPKKWNEIALLLPSAIVIPCVLFPDGPDARHCRIDWNKKMGDDHRRYDTIHTCERLGGLLKYYPMRLHEMILILMIVSAFLTCIRSRPSSRVESARNNW